jgi:hypothetical protein
VARSRRLPRHNLKNAAENPAAVVPTPVLRLLDLGDVSRVSCRRSTKQQPLAVAIIAGLVLQFPMVVLALPALLSLTLPTEVVAS